MINTAFSYYKYHKIFIPSGHHKQ